MPQTKQFTVDGQYSQAGRVYGHYLHVQRLRHNHRCQILELDARRFSPPLFDVKSYNVVQPGGLEVKGVGMLGVR